MTDTQLLRDRVSLSIDGGVADVRLARAPHRNALDSDMFLAIAEAIATIAASNARVVVLSGDGAAFCAGLDRTAFAEIAIGEWPSCIPADLVPRTYGIANLPQHAVVGWRNLAIPVIAAINGAALGGGLQIALGADIRIVAPDARLGLLEIQWGLVPDMGAMALLPDLVRNDILRELVYTGRTVEAQEAVAIGLATRMADDPLAAAFDMARSIAATSPSAVHAAKRLLEQASTVDRAALLQAESLEQQPLIRGADQREILTAMKEKRPPNFL